MESGRTLYANVGDIKIYYEIRGEGPPIIMIMGLSANKDWWPPQLVDKLSEKYRLILFDNRGAGRSDKPDIPYTMKMFANDTIGLMNVLEIKRAHIFGVSMGGMIAQEIAINYPNRVEKLILGCTTCGGPKGIMPSQEVLQMMTKARGEMPPEEYARKYVVPLLFTKETVEKRPEIIETFVKSYSIAPIPDFAYRRQLEAVIRHDTYDRLNKIKAHTLILHGKKDILVPPENADVLAEAIPNSKLVIFDNVGHAFIAEALDETCKAILEFLEE